MRVAVPDFVTPFSGIGVIQKELYPRLEAAGFEVLKYLSRQPASAGPAAAASSVLKALTHNVPQDVDALLSLTSPLPLRTPLPTVAMIYDLRWLRTRLTLGRLYRGWDLRRTVRRSSVLTTISERTASDLREAFPHAEVRVVYPGPGQLGVPTTANWSEAGRRSVLLIGAARHKRNELAAEVLALLRDDWLGNVCCVNVSQETRAILTSKVGSDRCEFHVNVSPEALAEMYAASGYSIQLGVDEGFGLPYIEALSAGCIVIAVDQPLTRELLGDAAVLVQDGEPGDIARQIREVANPPVLERRIGQAARYSWDSFAAGVGQALTLAANGAVD